MFIASIFTTSSKQIELISLLSKNKKIKVNDYIIHLNILYRKVLMLHQVKQHYKTSPLVILYIQCEYSKVY